MGRRRLILDTHVLIWALEENERALGQTLSDTLIDRANDIFVSVVTAWEMAIKRSVGKLQTPDDLPGALEELGFTQLLVNFDHARQAGMRPLIHRDPFDRMLIAQAQAEGLTLVTIDANIQRYAVPTMPARS